MVFTGEVTCHRASTLIAVCKNKFISISSKLMKRRLWHVFRHAGIWGRSLLVNLRRGSLSCHTWTELACPAPSQDSCAECSMALGLKFEGQAPCEGLGGCLKIVK